MTQPGGYTDDDLLAVLTAALQAGDMPGAAAVLRVLALQAPDKAQQILDVITARAEQETK